MLPSTINENLLGCIITRLIFMFIDCSFLKEWRRYRFFERKNKCISFPLWTFCYVSSKTFIYIKKSRLSNEDIAVEREGGSRKRPRMVRPVLVPFQFLMHIFILLKTEETVTRFFLIVIFKEPSAWWKCDKNKLRARLKYGDMNKTADSQTPYSPMKKFIQNILHIIKQV